MNLLWERILYALNGEEIVKERKINFYLVDAPSWFDESCTSLSNENRRRFDNIMASHDNFKNYWLSEYYFIDHRGGNPSFLWDEENAAARKRISQVHFITGEEVRQLVGDKVYGLTFAPPVHPASAPRPPMQE